jgi:hypothetical protein
MLISATTAAICQLQALSPVGRCKSFDDSGDGYGRGEGVALAVLSPVSALPHYALPHAVVIGSAVNQDGRSSGLTAPNGPSQTALVHAALAGAGAAAGDVSAVAVHGTGTPLGDPIEVGAIGAGLAASLRDAGDMATLALLSNKSCYGHTEGTAGMLRFCYSPCCGQSSVRTRFYAPSDKYCPVWVVVSMFLPSWALTVLACGTGLVLTGGTFSWVKGGWKEYSHSTYTAESLILYVCRMAATATDEVPTTLH